MDADVNEETYGLNLFIKGQGKMQKNISSVTKTLLLALVLSLVVPATSFATGTLPSPSPSPTSTVKPTPTPTPTPTSAATVALKTDVMAVVLAISSGIKTGDLKETGKEPNVTAITSLVGTLNVKAGIKIYISGSSFCVSNDYWYQLSDKMLTEGKSACTSAKTIFTPIATPTPTPTPTDPFFLAPPASAGITAKQVGTTMVVSWTLPKVKGRYPKSQKISISPSFGLSPQPGTIDMKLRKYKFTGLVQGQKYTIGISTTTPNKKYTTQVTSLMPPNPVTGLRGSRVLDNILLFWDRYDSTQNGTTQSSPADIGIITVTSPNSSPEVINVGLFSTTYRLSNRSKAVKYTIKFEYANTAGKSLPMQIDILPTTPNQPVKPTATLLTTSSVKLAWDYQGPDLSTQTITIMSATKGASRNGDIVSVNPTVKELTLTGLTPGATYTFQLVVSNSDGSSTPLSSDSINLLLPPTSPLNLKAVAADSSVILTWAAPADNGGAAVTSYTIEYRPDGTAAYNSPVSVAGTLLTKTISGLTNSTKYDFRVTAVTSFAPSQPTSEVSATPAAVPGVVTNLIAVVSSGAVVISWVAPLNNGGSSITGYTITYKSASETAFSTYNTSGLTANLTGLTNGVVYTFQVKANNATGSSAIVSTTATPFISPGVPLSLAVVAHPASLTATWLAPTSLGGLPLSSYSVQYKLATDTSWTTVASPTTALTSTISSLTNGSAYQVRVAATTGTTTKFTSDYTSPVTATPATIPGIPTGLVANPGNLAASLTWVAPTDNGGATIISYKVEYKTSVASVWTVATVAPSGTSCSVDSLLSGTVYNFRVSAINSVGTGTVSAIATTTPSTLPSAPASLTVTPGTGSLQLDWTDAPASGVSPITGYKVEYKLSTDSTWTTATSALALSYNLTGLVSGSLYDIQVSSINAIGLSLPRTGQGTPA